MSCCWNWQDIFLWGLDPASTKDKERLQQSTELLWLKPLEHSSGMLLGIPNHLRIFPTIVLAHEQRFGKVSGWDHSLLFLKIPFRHEVNVLTDLASFDDLAQSMMGYFSDQLRLNADKRMITTQKSEGGLPYIPEISSLIIANDHRLPIRLGVIPLVGHESSQTSHMSGKANISQAGQSIVADGEGLPRPSSTRQSYVIPIFLSLLSRQTRRFLEILIPTVLHGLGPLSHGKPTYYVEKVSLMFL